MPRTSRRTGHASMQTGVPHNKHRSASFITSCSEYGSWTSEKSVFLFFGSDFRNGNSPTRLGSTIYNQCKQLFLYCLSNLDSHISVGRVFNPKHKGDRKSQQ